ncbi:sulfatase-like hydrolase/transferase [Tamlana sp. 2201CG12-4]|nr:sulfatase-like hydrolase/transferase [Tamlana sp. 2201CG12-4]
MLCTLNNVVGQNDKFSRPNIILIMADDLGYAGLSSFGGEGIYTPQLDKLAQEGVKCTNFYSNSTVCSPTRVALMTGRYQQRVGLDHIYFHCLKDDGLDPDENKVLAKELKKVGYHTGVFGKWHLGAGEKYQPKNQGFDEFVGFLDGNIDFISHHNTESFADWWVDHKLNNQEGYATTLLNTAAVKFIEDNHQKPFFLYMPQAAVHVPMQGPNDKAMRTDEFYAYKVDHHFSKEEYMRRYSEMVAEMDKGVGQIMNTLRKYNIEDNTLVIFISDNGGEFLGVKHGKVNGNTRGHKGTMYEGGIKVPGVFYWKGKLSPGQVNTQVMLSMDIFPTVLKLAGVKSDRTNKPDGVDLWKTLSKGKSIKKRDVFWMHSERLVMRSDNLKLIRQNKGVELYDLEADPLEKNDLFQDQDYTKVISRMIQKSDAWRNKTAIGFPLKRDIGVFVKTDWPCKRDLKAFNKGKTWESLNK